jgi:hypothetical protein
MMSAIGGIVERVPVFRAEAKIGAGYAEWLRAELEGLGLAPCPREKKP